VLPHRSDSEVTQACAKHALQQSGVDEAAGAADTEAGATTAELVLVTQRGEQLLVTVVWTVQELVVTGSVVHALLVHGTDQQSLLVHGSVEHALVVYGIFTTDEMLYGIVAQEVVVLPQSPQPALSVVHETEAEVTTSTDVDSPVVVVHFVLKPEAVVH
jgi:hypothetical protein